MLRQAPTIGQLSDVRDAMLGTQDGGTSDVRIQPYLVIRPGNSAQYAMVDDRN